ncbi:MAG TPA: hypothetical protein DHW82_10570 [Spirochaetia bacterium]|nr:MAG: hypothetical protein A2Y41_01255 [Spirochaetes bacterium GWB1_36_13]HCL57436.1 hypothetical protein [Spirochaetia bacterium]
MKKIFLLALFFTFITLSSVYPATVFFKDGSQVNGKIIKENPTHLTVEVSGFQFDYAKDSILKIQLEEKDNKALVLSKNLKIDDPSRYNSFYLEIQTALPIFFQYQDRFETLKNNWDKKISIFFQTGIYFPLDQNLLIGGNSSLFYTNYKIVNSVYTASYTIKTYQIGLSAKYFYQQILEGIFFDFSLNYSLFSLLYTLDYYAYSIPQSKSTAEPSGLHASFGIGYSWELNRMDSSCIAGVKFHTLSGSKDDLKWSMNWIDIFIGILW